MGKVVKETEEEKGVEVKDGLRNRFLRVQLRPRNNRGLTCTGGPQITRIKKQVP